MCAFQRLDFTAWLRYRDTVCRFESCDTRVVILENFETSAGIHCPKIELITRVPTVGSQSTIGIESIEVSYLRIDSRFRISRAELGIRGPVFRSRQTAGPVHRDQLVRCTCLGRKKLKRKSTHVGRLHGDVNASFPSKSTHECPHGNDAEQCACRSNLLRRDSYSLR